MRFVDSHLHLSDFPDPRLALSYAETTDTMLLSCGIDRDTSGRTSSLSASHPESVKAFVGVHPSEVDESTEVGWVKEDLKTASGLGEVGLDPKYSACAPGSPQMRAFRTQLEYAEVLKRPVQVHSRGAAKECLDELGSFTLASVLLHWFDSPELIEMASGRGYFVSFGPSLTYSKRAQRMALSAERSLVLTETDGPVAYDPLGGAMGPSLIPSVLFKLAEVWGRSFAETSEAVAENCVRYLGKVEKG